MKIKPLTNYVVVEALPEGPETTGGVFIQAQTVKRIQIGEVLAIGSNASFKTAAEAEIGGNVKEGQKVVYRLSSIEELNIGGKTYTLVPYDDLLAILE